MNKHGTCPEHMYIKKYKISKMQQHWSNLYNIFHYKVWLLHLPYVLTWIGYYEINTTNTGIKQILLVYNKMIINYVTVPVKSFYYIWSQMCDSRNVNHSMSTSSWMAGTVHTITQYVWQHKHCYLKIQQFHWLNTYLYFLLKATVGLRVQRNVHFDYTVPVPGFIK